MTNSNTWLATLAALALPVTALAQSNDASYCAAMSEKYLRYAGPEEQRRGQQPQNLSALVAIEKCKAGDTATGIPMLEKALKDAKLDLPART